MMSDAERGSFWTNALLGMPAKEVHLCGSSWIKNCLSQLLAETHETVLSLWLFTPIV
ncbi:MAG: hypothetical protein P4M11_10970 [Candidatus Pacebacteria bacterium]|nr:hypothetical protein [Candidatus Paceibacterota bacterium]